MTDSQIQIELMGRIALAKLLNAGYNDREIGVILIRSLCEELWKKMTPEQKAEYNNDLNYFCEKEIREAEKKRAKERDRTNISKNKNPQD